MELPPRPVRNLSNANAQLQQHQRLTRQPQPQSIAMRTSNHRNSNNVHPLSEYSDAFNHVFDAILKLGGAEEEFCSSWSDSSLTVPETVATNDFDNVHNTNNNTISFQLCGDYTEKEQQEAEHEYCKRSDQDGERDDVDEMDDDISVSSDCVPLVMTDQDAIDEIEFTRGLTGYVEGFDDYNLIVRRMLEEDQEEENQRENERIVFPPKPRKIRSYPTKGGHNQRPPLPLWRPPSQISESTKPPGHGRTNSGRSSSPFSKIVLHALSGASPHYNARTPVSTPKSSHRRARSRDSVDFARQRSSNQNHPLPATPARPLPQYPSRSSHARDRAPLVAVQSSFSPNAPLTPSPLYRRRSDSGESTTPADPLVWTTTTNTAVGAAAAAGESSLSNSDRKRTFLRFPRPVSKSIPPKQFQTNSGGSQDKSPLTCTVCGRQCDSGAPCICGMKEI